MESVNNIRQINKILCIIKAEHKKNRPILLTQLSKDWSMPLLINIDLPEKKEQDIYTIKSLLSKRLDIDEDNISIEFDRDNKSLFTSTKKLTADPEKREIYGPFGLYNFYYCVVKINKPNSNMLKSLFSVGSEWYSWLSIGSMKSIPLVRKHNFDVLGFLTKNFDQTLGKIENGIVEYINVVIDESDIVRSFNDSSQSWRTIIDKLISEKKIKQFQYDAFISYASEDRETFVEPLVRALKAEGLSIWYDKDDMVAGDSIVKSIGRGLSKSRYAITIISKLYIEKKWTKKEYDLIQDQYIREDKRIIPVWLDMTEEDIADFCSILAGICAIRANRQDINRVKSEISRSIRTLQLE